MFGSIEREELEEFMLIMFNRLVVIGKDYYRYVSLIVFDYGIFFIVLVFVFIEGY